MSKTIRLRVVDVNSREIRHSPLLEIHTVATCKTVKANILLNQNLAPVNGRSVAEDLAKGESRRRTNGWTDTGQGVKTPTPLVPVAAAALNCDTRVY